MWKCLTGHPKTTRLDLYPTCHEIVNYKEYLSNRNLISILYINLIYGRMGVLVCITALPALRWLSSQSTGWGGGLDLPTVQVNRLSHPGSATCLPESNPGFAFLALHHAPSGAGGSTAAMAWHGSIRALAQFQEVRDGGVGVSGREVEDHGLRCVWLHHNNP